MTESNPGQDVGDSAFDAPEATIETAPGDDLDIVEDDIKIVDEVTVVDGLERVRLFGLDLVSAESLDPVIEEILYGPRRDDQVLPVVLTPNVDIIVHLDKAPGSIEAEMFERAQFCLPDGQPLVMVSRFLGGRLKARLPGSGLFHDLWPRIVEENVPTMVVASSDDIARRLEREHPKAGFVVPPIFDADDAGAIDEIVGEMLTVAQACNPELVLVGIGNPKDARLIAALFDRWPETSGPKPLCLGLGGSFSMYLGFLKRAPDWIQRMGMEWFYRFLQEPRRLFHRYFVRDMAFFGIVRREWQAARSKR